MKKIALITDGWRRYITYAWVCGIADRARELGIDICLYTFNTNGNLSHDAKYNEGEYSLYELIDYPSYDGFVFDCTNTTDPDVIDSIVSKLKSAPAPVVSISYYVEGFHYVGNDNKNLIHSVVDHMYDVHGCRRMIFVGGPEKNYENIQRFEAFCEALEKHGLELKEDSYSFGDYDFDTGVRFISKWIDDGKEFPDAFICANDNIAAGLCSEAIKRGCRVPEDIRVTGFDNLDKAAYYKPQIASVDHNRGFLGSRAFDILLSLMNNEEVDLYTYMHSEIVPAESCGCANTGRVDYRDYAKWQIDWGVDRDRREENILELEKRFADCRTIEGLFESFTEYVRTLDCAGLFICVDRNLLEAAPDSDLSENGFIRERMVVVSGDDHKERLYGIRSIDDLKEYLGKAESPREYIFLPIHFRNRRVGTTVLLDPHFLYDYSHFYDVHHTFVERLENLFIQTQLSNAASRMRSLYNRDMLTGLYNRISYNEMIVSRFETYRHEGIKCAIVFFDVDRFKDINDSYGHDFGDKVLITIAGALKRYKPKDAHAYRFGGDEFVVFIPYAFRDKVERFVKRVEKELSDRHIGISSGAIYTDKDFFRTSDEYLMMADERMYEVKRTRHEKHGALAGYKELGNKPDVEKKFDDITFYKGMDISSIPKKEDKGFKFLDRDGNVTDPFDLITGYNVNSVRLRLWNDPSQYPESGGYCDLDHTLKMAKRIRDKGLHFVLDFHYSDYWADPGKQEKPHAWKDYDLEGLIRAVYVYTRHVLTELSRIDALPDMVQIGNEIRSGMLFPDGAAPDYQSLAMLVNSGIKAVRDISEDIEVMIHLDQGGRFFYLREWFDSMFAAGMDRIDAIGISFYPFWHGTYMDLKNTMSQLTDRYDLPVYVVETAHPWRHCENEHVNRDMMRMAGMPAGIEEQKDSLLVIMQIAAAASGAKKTGVYYWEPLCITDSNLSSWDENMGMLDTEHKPLSSFDAYRDFDPDRPPFDDLDSLITSLYKKKDDEILPAGTNLLLPGDFSDGLSSWWITPSSDDVEYRAEDHELCISSRSNFTFELCREIRIDRAGTYSFSLKYRGSNTTGMSVCMYVKEITCNGEKYQEKPIYPSDVEYVTWTMDDLRLDACNVRVGIKLDSSPAYGRITGLSLIELS